MLIIGKPQIEDIEKYVVADNEQSKEFQLNGFMPKYFEKDTFYFIKDDELLKFIERSDEN